MTPATCPVLIADDDPFVRLGLSSMLEDVGIHCKSADGMGAAITLVRSGFRPVLLMTDQRMDDGTGSDLAHALLPVLPGLKILLVSGDELAKDGIPDDWHFLAKPFLAQELYDKIAEILPGLDFDA